MQIANFNLNLEKNVDPRIDPRRSAAELSVEDKASADAQRNYPLSNAIAPGHTELEIASRHEQRMAGINLGYMDKLQAIRNEQVTLRQQFTFPPFPAEIHGIEQQLATLNTSFATQGAPLQYECNRRKSDVDAFKNKACLTRELNEPRSLALHLALAVFLVLAEAGANAPFFAAGNSLGLLGGLGTAASVAALNVFLALGAGALLRYVNHVSWRVKALAWGFTGAYASGLCVFHLGIAHWRNALSGLILNVDPGMEGRAALVTLMQHPFSLLSIESCLLVVIGVGFAVVALIAGYRAKDPIPGYSEVVARYREAAEALKHFKDAYVMQFNAIFEGANDKRNQIPSAEQRIDRVLTDAQSSIGAYLASAATTERLMLQYRALRALVDASLIYCHSLYRSVNRTVRTSDAPAYFRDAPPVLSDDKCLDVARFTPVTIDEVAQHNALVSRAESAKATLREIQKAGLAAIPALFAALEEANGALPVAVVAPAASSAKGTATILHTAPARASV